MRRAVKRLVGQATQDTSANGTHCWASEPSPLLRLRPLAPLVEAVGAGNLETVSAQVRAEVVGFCAFVDRPARVEAREKRRRCRNAVIWGREAADEGESTPARS